MSGAVALRASLLVFVAAMVQTVVVPPFVVGSGAPDLLLLVVVSLGLLRGSVAGAVFGFGGGLIVDTLMLDTLGVTSLVLTLAGFWAGRYAETSGSTTSTSTRPRGAASAFMTTMRHSPSSGSHSTVCSPAPDADLEGVDSRIASGCDVI